MDDKLEIGNAVAMMTFAAVVSTGSFSAAADALGYSKAAVSRQVAQLEGKIGLKLLERTTRSIALTPAGREIYNRCARIIDEVQEANDLLFGINSMPQGDLKVNATVVSSLFKITDVIPEFLQKYPDLRLLLNLSDSKVDLFKSEFDIAFWVGDTYDSSLDAVKLCEYEMVLAGATEYLDRRGRPRSPNELKEHDCIIETHLSRPGEWRLSSDQIIHVSRVRLTSNSVRITREGLLAGMGLAFLPRFLVEQDLASKRIETVLPDLVTTRLPLYLIYPKGRYALAKVKAFVDYFSAVMGESARNDNSLQPRQASVGANPARGRRKARTGTDR